MKKKLTSSQRKKISEAWKCEFSDLSIYKNVRLFRIVGPLIQGITLDRDSSNSNYLPTFHVHNLGKQDDDFISLTLKSPLLSEKTKYPDKITLSRHEAEFSDIITRFKKQIPLPLSGDLNLKMVLKAYKTYIKNGGALTQYPFYEYIDIMHIYLWVQATNEAQKFHDNIRREVENWPTNIKSKIEINYQRYEKDIKEIFNNPKLLKENVENEIDKLGLNNFQRAELIG